MGSPSDWKTEEQSEFLLSHWSGFKSSQDSKTLDRFWPKLFEEWFHRWPIPPSPTSSHTDESSGADPLAARKEKSSQIKHWFNNRCRAGESSKRGDLKLDTNPKRKLAPLQAYCSYVWESTLRPIALARWEQQEDSAAFVDEDDPPSDTDMSSIEASIPLRFKLKIAKEFYDKLTPEEKKDIDRRREEEQKKVYRKIPQIANEEERIAKLRIHQSNQPLVPKAMGRILKNLDQKTGCISQLLVASVDPADGRPIIQKFCEGRTEHGVDFESFYGDDWGEHVEKKFGEWALRIFGAKDSERREKFCLPPDPSASSQASTSEVSSPQNSSNPTAPSQESTPGPGVSQKSTSRPAASQKSTSRPAASQKSTPRPAASQKSTSRPAASQKSTSRPAASQKSTSRPAASQKSKPQPTASQKSLPQTPSVTTSKGSDVIVSQGPSVTTPEGSDAVDPSQPVISSSEPFVEPSQITVEPSQSIPESPCASAGAVTVDAQPDTSTPPQLPKETTIAPTVPYRVRDLPSVTSGAPSRRGSIDGAPEIILDLHSIPQTQGPANDDEPELVVDLRDYINIDSDSEAESHVSSSQKSADEFTELRISSPVQRAAKAVDSPQSTPTHASHQLGIDEGDLPAWMVRKGQWKYVASTPGGPIWEKLLRVYMEQERRLEFMDIGATLTNEDRPSKIKEYFQYAHHPSRGDTLKVPGFGTEVGRWWQRIQPEWRRSGQGLPQSPSQWSYILSGGSKGVFLVIMCLAWWDRAHARYLEEVKDIRRTEAVAAGVSPNFSDLPDHDAEWLRIVNDAVLVIEKARDCGISTRGMSSPSHRTKRQRETEPSTPRKKPAVRTSSRARSKA